MQKEGAGGYIRERVPSTSGRPPLQTVFKPTGRDYQRRGVAYYRMVGYCFVHRPSNSGSAFHPMPRHFKLMFFFSLSQQSNILNIFALGKTLGKMENREGSLPPQKKRQNPNRCRPKSRGGCQRCKQRRVSRGESRTFYPFYMETLFEFEIVNTYPAQM